MSNSVSWAGGGQETGSGVTNNCPEVKYFPIISYQIMFISLISHQFASDYNIFLFINEQQLYF